MLPRGKALFFFWDECGEHLWKLFWLNPYGLIYVVLDFAGDYFGCLEQKTIQNTDVRKMVLNPCLDSVGICLCTKSSICFCVLLASVLKLGSFHSRTRP